VCAGGFCASWLIVTVVEVARLLQVVAPSRMENAGAPPLRTA
jgi:hypothetical protein